MKKIVVSTIFFLNALVVCTATNAANTANTIKACLNKQTNNISFSQCLDGIKESVDRELQTWVNNQVFILEKKAQTTGRRSALTMFKRSQKNFVTFRENNCRWQYLARSPSINAGPAYKKCYILLTKNRIQELSKLN